MLRELRIRDFAVVEEMTLELGPGLAVLTGETGAGKSILVEALGLLVGGRPSADMIRAGSGRTVVEGRFEVGDNPAVLAACEEAGVDVEDGWLILRRELRREGRHRAWVNSSPSTTMLLRTLGERLLDLHGQHEHQRLLDRSEQRRILDAFGEHTDLAAELAGAHDRWSEIRERLDEVRAGAREGRERADYLRFKADEIEGAGLEAGEDERLETEARRLGHSEDLIALARGLSDGLYEADGAVVERLGELGRSLRDLVDIDPSARHFLDLHENALRSLEELGREVGRYGDAVDHDPARLEDIRARLDELYRLKRKYGGTLDEVIETGRSAREELDGIDGADEEIRRLEKDEAALAERLEGLADRLTSARRDAGDALRTAVEATLPALGLEGGRLDVDFERLDRVGRGGRERVRFLVSLNPGLPPGPLARIASGGEMSRLMLALKTALVAVDDVPILVFDEIDAGIGGEVAHRVAERLVHVSAGHQVLAVTHLAQIAARADAHHVVTKDAGEDETRTAVRTVAGAARVEELARMLGGDPGSARSRAHAEELLSGRI
ncbi:MAG: DNA repair protein RecN [Gemmatimonadota bacterium]|nr:DNA repair protein RecN [Gemmatimonadota bacterium]